MSCETIQIPGAGTAIVCTRSRRSIPTCSIDGCQGRATLLCDADTTRAGRARTCDAPICAAHATTVGHDLHHCPKHAHVAAPQKELFHG